MGKNSQQTVLYARRERGERHETPQVLCAGYPTLLRRQHSNGPIATLKMRWATC